MSKYSYADVVPQGLQDELIALRDSISRNYWDVGDIGIMVCNYVDDNEIYVSREFIWSAIGSYAGLSARTVREYWRIARFFPADVRAQYEVLSFAHFMFASRFPDYWKSVLDFAVSETDTMGRPATIDKLEVVFTYGKITDAAPGEYHEPKESEWQPQIETQIYDDGWRTPEEQRPVVNPQGNILNHVQGIKYEIERLSISEEFRDEISDHLNAIERLLQLVTVQ